MAAGLIIDKGAFFWNVSSRVGPGCPNKPDDVQLVQLGYYCMAINTKHPVAADEKAIYSKVVPGATYTGSPSDPLTLAIRRHEQRVGGTQDGVVSPMTNASGGYGPNTVWLIARLNNHIANVLGGPFPLLDQHPKCGPALKETVGVIFRYNSK